MITYDTVTHAIQDLNSKGYKSDFNLKSDCIQDVDDKLTFKPSEFEVEAVFRFEGMTNPADNMILYKITAGSKKGTMLESYSDSEVQINHEMREKLSQKSK